MGCVLFMVLMLTFVLTVCDESSVDEYLST